MSDYETIVVKYSTWHRVGLRYVQTVGCKYNGETLQSIYSYGFFTYHLIKWQHGEEFMTQLINENIENTRRRVIEQLPYYKIDMEVEKYLKSRGSNEG